MVPGDAAHLVALLAERGLNRADAVICGLPWALFDQRTQEAILGQVSQVIGTTGAFTTFAYLHEHDAGRGPAVPGHPAGDVRRGGGERDGVAQRAARVRLRVPAPGPGPGAGSAAVGIRSRRRLTVR